MSARDDASLTDRERAALAGLEATAAAEDPRLASRLKGSSRLRVTTHFPSDPSVAAEPLVGWTVDRYRAGAGGGEP